jgi:hypothetical protein
MNLKSESGSLVPAVTIIVCLIAVLCGPFLVFEAYEFGYVDKIPTSVVNWMFFGPQYVFPFNTYTAAKNSVRVSPFVWILTWIVVVVSFSWFCRKLNFGLSIIAALATIAITTMAMHVVFAWLGWRFNLDGP